MKCPKCGSHEVCEDAGYATVFRCKSCNFVGNEQDFKGCSHG